MAAKFLKRPVTILCILILSCAFAYGVKAADEDICRFIQKWQIKEQSYPGMFGILSAGGEPDEVVNLMRLGLAAMAGKDDLLAADCMDTCILRIEELYGPGKDATKRRKRFFEAANDATKNDYKEEVKHFRGEPYERMMVYYYRGLLYASSGDRENARACWSNGIMQDAIAEEEQNRCDFAPLEVLCAWESVRTHSESLAENSEKRLKELGSEVLLPEPGQNVLVIVQAGNGPVKTRTGNHGQLLTFSCGQPSSMPAAASVRLLVENRTFRLKNLGSLCWQASTRGGRAIDGILAHKAIWKGEWEGITACYSSGLSVSREVARASDFNAGRAMSMPRGSMMPSRERCLMDSQLSAVHGVGGSASNSRQSRLAKQIADAAHPEADIRQFEGLADIYWMNYACVPEKAETFILLVDYGTETKEYRIERSKSTLNDRCDILWLDLRAI